MPAQIQPKAVVLYRVLGAVIFFWVITPFFTKEKLARPDMARLFLCAVFGVMLNQILFLEGVSRTVPIHASLIMIMVPILVLAITAIFLKEKISQRKLSGIIVGFFGAAMLIAGGHRLSIENIGLWGDILIFVNAISFAVYLVIVQGLMKKYHPLTITKWLFLFGLILVLPITLPDFLAVEYAGFTGWTYAVIAFVIFFVTCITYFLYIIALKSASASVVSTYIYLQPLLTGILAVHIVPYAAQLFHFSYDAEELTFSKVAAGILIFIGLTLVNFTPRKSVSN